MNKIVLVLGIALLLAGITGVAFGWDGPDIGLGEAVFIPLPGTTTYYIKIQDAVFMIAGATVLALGAFA